MATDNEQLQWRRNAPRAAWAGDESSNASVGVLTALGVLAYLGVRPLLRGIGGLIPKSQEDGGATPEALEMPEVLDMPDVSEVFESQRVRRQLRLNG
jgi:hypothetical protein